MRHRPAALWRQPPCRPTLTAPTRPHGHWPLVRSDFKRCGKRGGYAKRIRRAPSLLEDCHLHLGRCGAPARVIGSRGGRGRVGGWAACSRRGAVPVAAKKFVPHMQCTNKITYPDPDEVAPRQPRVRIRVRGSASPRTGLPRRPVAHRCRAFDHAAAVQHDDLVHRGQPLEAVGDQDSRAALRGSQQVGGQRVGRGAGPGARRARPARGRGSRRGGPGPARGVAAGRRRAGRRTRRPGCPGRVGGSPPSRPDGRRRVPRAVGVRSRTAWPAAGSPAASCRTGGRPGRRGRSAVGRCRLPRRARRRPDPGRRCRCPPVGPRSGAARWRGSSCRSPKRRRRPPGGPVSVPDRIRRGPAAPRSGCPDSGRSVSRTRRGNGSAGSGSGCSGSWTGAGASSTSYTRSAERRTRCRNCTAWGSGVTTSNTASGVRTTVARRSPSSPPAVVARAPAHAAAVTVRPAARVLSPDASAVPDAERAAIPVSSVSASVTSPRRAASAPVTGSSPDAVPVSRSTVRTANRARAGASRRSVRRERAAVSAGTAMPATARPTARAAPAAGSSQAAKTTAATLTVPATVAGSSQRRK